MVRKEDSRMPRSTLELEVGLNGTTSKDEVKGGARIWDCIGIVEFSGWPGNSVRAVH